MTTLRTPNLSMKLEVCYMCPKQVPAFVKKGAGVVRATNIQFLCCNRRHHFYDDRIGKRPCHHRKNKHSIQVSLGCCVVVLVVSGAKFKDYRDICCSVRVPGKAKSHS